VCDRISDRRRFAVVQGPDRGSDHKAFEVLQRGFAKSGELHKAGGDKLFQQVRVLPVPAAPFLKLLRHDVDDDDRVRECPDDFLRAARSMSRGHKRRFSGPKAPNGGGSPTFACLKNGKVGKSVEGLAAEMLT
jgi:hypothetical protein